MSDGLGAFDKVIALELQLTGMNCQDNRSLQRLAAFDHCVENHAGSNIESWHSKIMFICDLQQVYHVH